MIELRGVTKRFGTRCAVDGLDLEVRAGELFAFLGPNGAGKTTTIKMICGLLAPSSGTVRVGGFEASSQQARQLLGYVPDQPYLYDKLTGREFLKFVVEMYGLERPARRPADPRADRHLRDGRLRRRAVRELLARDEATGRLRLGPGARSPRSWSWTSPWWVSTRAVLGSSRICSWRRPGRGCAVLMSTHLLAIAEELADRIGIVDHGKMLALGHAGPAPTSGPAPRAARGPFPEADGRPAVRGRRATAAHARARARDRRVRIMSLAIPDTTRLTLPPIPADQTARACDGSDGA